jgi:hypothetical protein
MPHNKQTASRRTESIALQRVNRTFSIIFPMDVALKKEILQLKGCGIDISPFYVGSRTKHSSFTPPHTDKNKLTEKDNAKIDTKMLCYMQ